MLLAIENAILDRLNEKGYQAYHLDEMPTLKGSDIQTAVAAIYTESGEFEKYTDLSVSCEVKIVCFLAWQHEVAQNIRKRGLYPILMNVSSLLLFQTMGLDIDPIMPASFKRNSPREMEIGGVVAYDAVFKTKFLMSQEPDVFSW